MSARACRCDLCVCDLVSSGPGDACPRCGKPMQPQARIDVGHVFKLGTKYTVIVRGLF
jgi:prolyl-tRNA synthetase